MPIYECFSGLFAASPINSVARVAGVAPQEFDRKSNAISFDKGKNTPCNSINGRVSVLPAATPDTTRSHGDGVAQENKEIQGNCAHKTPATPETQFKHDADKWRDVFYERAAMVEFEGKFPRHMAAAVAYWDTFLQFATNRNLAIRAEFDAIINERPLN